MNVAFGQAANEGKDFVRVIRLLSSPENVGQPQLVFPKAVQLIDTYALARVRVPVFEVSVLNGNTSRRSWAARRDQRVAVILLCFPVREQVRSAHADPDPIRVCVDGP